MHTVNGESIRLHRLEGGCFGNKGCSAESAKSEGGGMAEERARRRRSERAVVDTDDGMTSSSRLCADILKFFLLCW